MRGRITAAAAAWLLAAGWAGAAELTIELPVTTPPDPYTVQVAPVAWELSLERIARIAVRLQGTYRDQLFFCGTTPGVETETTAGRVLVLLGDAVLTAPAVARVHEFPANPGAGLPYDVTLTLLEGGPAGWEFLADGSCQLGLADHPDVVDSEAGYSDCYPVAVFGTIASADLIITYDVEVPVEPARWDALKALYR